MHARLFGLFLLFFSPALTHALDIIFEGYYKITHEKAHIGYTIQRYGYDPKTKTFEVITFTRVALGGVTTTESLKAVANDKLEPLSYQYTTQAGDQIKLIDGKFKPQVMELKTTTDGKVAKNETYKIPEKTFLSVFVVLRLLQQELTPNPTPLKYSAVAEEEGSSFWGTLTIEKQSVTGDLATFLIRNRFRDETWIAQLVGKPLGKLDPSKPNRFSRLEVFATESPEQNLRVELVDSPDQATKDQTLPNKTLIALFGNVPSGKVTLKSGATKGM